MDLPTIVRTRHCRQGISTTQYLSRFYEAVCFARLLTQEDEGLGDDEFGPKVQKVLGYGVENETRVRTNDPHPAQPGILPEHGRINCSRCFDSAQVCWAQYSLEKSGWRVANNPMAWGKRLAEVLVLGFSKGGNQNSDILSRDHNEVAFRGGRKELSLILETLGLKISLLPIPSSVPGSGTPSPSPVKSHIIDTPRTPNSI
jgi:hypothetical protein